MYIYNSIPHITNTLNLGKDLLEVLFEKRKSLPFRYDYALDIIDENKLNILIEREVIRRNGPYIEMDEHYLSFYELLLEANEEISTSVIDENIQLVYQLIDYYSKEDNDLRKLGYLRSVKAHLRKIGKILVRNVVSLQRVIDNTFKNEPSYKVKIAKLENLDKKRINIQRLIDTTEHLILHEERAFFMQATDEELTRILLELRRELQLSAHSLIRAQQDIINYLNQIKSQIILVEKIRKVKYLQDQFELRARSNLAEVVEREHSLLMEGSATGSFKLSINYLSTDEARPVILKVMRNRQYREALRNNEAGAFSEEELEAQAMYQELINLDTTVGDYFQAQAQARWADESAPLEDLFSYLMKYSFQREVSEKERTTLFCQIVSLYETQLRITEEFGTYHEYEFAKVYPL